MVGLGQMGGELGDHGWLGTRQWSNYPPVGTYKGPSNYGGCSKGPSQVYRVLYRIPVANGLKCQNPFPHIWRLPLRILAPDKIELGLCWIQSRKC